MKIHHTYSIDDHPTLTDRMLRAASIQQKAILIANCRPPRAFAIHGDWGSGKTSYLRQLRYHLDGSKEDCHDDAPETLESGKFEDRIITVWFDAWRYQHEPMPIIALLQEMRRQLASLIKLKEEIRKLSSVALLSLLNVMGEAGKLIGFETKSATGDGINAVGEKWERENLEVRLGTDTIQTYLEKL